MFKNYFKIALRNLWRNKGFSAINILGLAIGMASAILILLWIQNEVSHDTFHAKKDRLYVMNNREKLDGELRAWPSTPKAMAPALKKDYPDVEDAVRVSEEDFLFSVADKHLNVRGAIVDSGFLSMFSFPLLQGNKSALGGNYSIVVTQKFAKKLFGNESPMGKTILIDSIDNFTVTGVLADLPNNTRFGFEYLLPWTYLTKLEQDEVFWLNNSVRTFVLLKPGVAQASFDAKVKDITANHVKDNQTTTLEVFTQLFSDAWLYSKQENGKYTTGRIERVKLFSIIAIFILLVACINFMNLSTARSEKRAKEVGIRKVAGAKKGSLILQFIGESILLAIIAGVIAVSVVQLCLPAFNQLVGKDLFIDFSNPVFWCAAIGFVLVTGLLAGSYPAFYLSSYQPVKVLKGTFKSTTALVTPRKVLVVLQFTFAIALIICTIIVQRQIQYAQAREKGYAQSDLIYINLNGEIGKHYKLIKEALLNQGAAVAVTKSMSPITQRYSDGSGFSWPGSTTEDGNQTFIRMASDADFSKTLGVKIIQGRDIDINTYASDSNAMLLNETAVKTMRLKDPIGQVIKNGDSWHVVGVVKDFIFESPFGKVGPLVVLGANGWFNVMHIKLNAQKTTAANLSVAEKIFKEYNPQYPFEYIFIDEEYGTRFRDEKRVGTLAGLFAGLTIFISCLGLFGLAAYMAQNRIKEIGVRKVLGASVSSITALLSKDFLKLVILSFAIATPVAWWAMSRWLAGYDYRIQIQWWVFAIAGMLSVFVALVTVSYQAIRAAIANPIKSLRTE